MRGTLSNFFAWGRLTFGTRGFPILVALITVGAPIAVLACGDTGPSPIGDYPDEDAGGDTTEPPPDEDAGDEDAGDAGEDAGDEEEVDAGKDAGDAGDAGDADTDNH